MMFKARGASPSYINTATQDIDIYNTGAEANSREQKPRIDRYKNS